MKLLFVEDSDSDIQAFQSSLKVVSRKESLEIDHENFKTVNEAFEALDNSYDGAIVDLRLLEGGSGQEVIKKIHDHYRIPVVVFTGTPAEVGKAETKFLRVFTKGSDTYVEALEHLIGIFNTGVTKIMGMRGVIEKSLDNIFWDSLIPNIESWMLLGREREDVESSMLRHIVSHVEELLDGRPQSTAPECYVVVSDDDQRYRTGEILANHNGDHFMILTPACDLVLRNDGQPKSENLLVCLVEESEAVISEALEGVKRLGSKKTKITQALRNNHSLNFHWLPGFSGFSGGFLNFRKLECIDVQDVKSNHSKIGLKVSGPFVKDIVSRFSGYYARQGQPDIDVTEIVDQLMPSEG